MNKLLAFYYALPHDRTFGILSKAFNRVVARLLKRVLDRTVPAQFLRTQHLYPNGLNTEPRDKRVIVSLTSFPARIEDVWIVIECLFRQSFKADKIILWLSKPQFDGVEMPRNLLDQKKRGLEIIFVDDDLRSHKKYLYAFEKFPNDYIITVDDDLYYDNGFLENLAEINEYNPNCVATNRAHKITFKSVDRLNSYRLWKHNVTDTEPSILLIPTGGAGTLYPPNSLPKPAFDKDLIKQLSFYADDLWLKMMTLLLRRRVVTNKRYNKDFITIKSTQKEKLVSKNVQEGGNDRQLAMIIDHFDIKISEIN